MELSSSKNVYLAHDLILIELGNSSFKLNQGCLHHFSVKYKVFLKNWKGLIEFAGLKTVVASVMSGACSLRTCTLVTWAGFYSKI